jgi:hypothetical protein
MYGEMKHENAVGNGTARSVVTVRHCPNGRLISVSRREGRNGVPR